MQDAIADISACEFLNSGYVGIYLDASSAGSNFKQCTLAQNQVGLMMVAGAVKLEQCDYVSNSVGVLVSTYEKLELEPPAEVVPVSIDIVGGEFQKNSEGHLLVWGPCRISVDGWNGAPPSEMPTPNVIEGLDVKLEKNVYEITDKSRKNNAL